MPIFRSLPPFLTVLGFHHVDQASWHRESFKDLPVSTSHLTTGDFTGMSLRTRFIAWVLGI